MAPGPRPVHFVLPEGAGANRQTAPGSDPRDGPGNRVRWPQGRRARDPGGAQRLRTCSEPRTRRRSVLPPVPSGAFVCADADPARPAPSVRYGFAGCPPPVTPRPTLTTRAHAPRPAVQDWRTLRRRLLDHERWSRDSGSARSSPCCRPTCAGWASPEADRLAFVGLVQRADLRRRACRSSRSGACGPTSTAARRSSSAARSSRPSSSRASPSPASRGSSRCSMLLIGFQLGNTGVMLAGIRDVTPRPADSGRSSRSSAASGPIGFAVGPVLAGDPHRRPRLAVPGGVLVLGGAVDRDRAAWSWFGSTEVRPEVVPDGSASSSSRSAPCAASFSDPAVRRIFVIFGFVVPRQPDDPAVHPRPRRGR